MWQYIFPITIVLILFTQSALSRTILVPSQVPYISKAISHANSGDTILVLPGTYSGNYNRMFRLNGKNIKILSVSGPELTVIKLNNAQGFFIESGEDSTTIIRGFTIQGGDAGPEWSEDHPVDESSGGAFKIRNSSPLIENCIIENNTGFYGSGIFVSGTSSGASPTFRNCIFRYNTNFWGAGAAAFLSDDQTKFINCLFLNNNTAWGGGLFFSKTSSVFINCTFIGNESRGKGASQTITAWYSPNKPTFIRCLIWGNRTPQISSTPFEEESTFNPIIENSIIFGNPDYQGLLDLEPTFNDTLVYNSGLQVDGQWIGSFFEVPPAQTNSFIRLNEFHYWVSGIGLAALLTGFLFGFFLSKRLQSKSLELITETQDEIKQTSKVENAKQFFQAGIHCLGEFKIISPDGTNLIPDLPAKSREVLGWLLIKSHGQEVSVSRLIDEVWRGEPPPSIYTVNNQLSKIHKLTEKLPQWLILKRHNGLITFQVDDSVYWDYRVVNQILRNGRKPELNNVNRAVLQSCLEKGMIFSGFLSDWAGNIQFDYQQRLLNFLRQIRDDQNQQVDMSDLLGLLLNWYPSDPDIIEMYHQALLSSGKNMKLESSKRLSRIK